MCSRGKETRALIDPTKLSPRIGFNFSFRDAKIYSNVTVT